MDVKNILKYYKKYIKVGYSQNNYKLLFISRLVGLVIGVFLLVFGKKYKKYSISLILFIIIGPFLILVNEKEFTNEHLIGLITLYQNIKRDYSISILLTLIIFCFSVSYKLKTFAFLIKMYLCYHLMKIFRIFNFRMFSSIKERLSEDSLLVLYIITFCIILYLLYDVFNYIAPFIINLFINLIGGCILLLSALSIKYFNKELDSSEQDAFDNFFNGLKGTLIILGIFLVCIVIESIYKKRVPKIRTYNDKDNYNLYYL
ncbi:hypothetical protein H311_00249 [Anncaliia algerae PRA109]|nr:hypothetical protein H311_00249 [Anncaliia algerae PRA109]